MGGALRSMVLVAAVVVGLRGSVAASSPVGQAVTADARAAWLPSSTMHVRAVSEKAASLLEQGSARSATFRRLVGILEQSDVIVQIDTGYLRGPGQLTFVAATAAARYVRITMKVPAVDDDLLPLLAHELQHAVEIASAPGIIGQQTLQAFYRNHGLVGPDGTACTRAAQEVAVIVGREIVRGSASQSQREPR
jgi:hypothetical protein